MRVPDAKLIREELGLTQEQFVRRYRVPIAMLRSWEMGRKKPNPMELAYLTVIARNPKLVEESLFYRPPGSCI